MSDISAKKVQDLRKMTGAGMMDCKKALVECDGDIEKAVEHLRKTGIAKAAKKLGRDVSDGRVHAYIHAGAKLGVLLEVFCETDFVARTEDFINFCNDVAMQIAAEDPLAVTVDQLDPNLVEKEKEIYKGQARESGKPEAMLEKIVDGKIEKFYDQTVLLRQTSIKDSTKTIEQTLQELIGKLGENIQIGNFARFKIGE
ncbi:MAG TPA: translation elongation factor Ts [candidate division Zixibacteria bacterium]|nr:translation elongation factor Ts [candidate division Zixibacteria bacterium]